eukprot:Opistho-1_new@9170
MSNANPQLTVCPTATCSCPAAGTCTHVQSATRNDFPSGQPCRGDPVSFLSSGTPSDGFGSTQPAYDDWNWDYIDLVLKNESELISAYVYPSAPVPASELAPTRSQAPTTTQVDGQPMEGCILPSSSAKAAMTTTEAVFDLDGAQVSTLNRQSTAKRTTPTTRTARRRSMTEHRLSTSATRRNEQLKRRRYAPGRSIGIDHVLRTLSAAHSTNHNALTSMITAAIDKLPR